MALRSWPAEPGCTCAPSREGSTRTPSRAIPRSGHGSRAELEANGLDPLVDRLRQLAPTRAAQIDLRNPRRVVRALEIAELQGDAGVPEPLGYDGPVAWLGLTVEPGIHERWIAERARDQFDAGLIDEARALRERFDPSLPAFSAIGYREAWAVLDGELTHEAAIELDAKRNVAFAKRQRTWFRSEPGIEWINSTSTSPRRYGAHARSPAPPRD